MPLVNRVGTVRQVCGCLLVALACLAVALGRMPANRAPVLPHGRTRPNIQPRGHLPLAFEVNAGQTDPSVKFLARGKGYNLFLTAAEAVFDFRGSAPGLGKRSDGPPISTVLRMKLLGANASAKADGVDELPGKSNYFIGNDPSKWRTNVPSYKKASFRNVYRGIDLVYYGHDSQMEFDFVVAPGSDPRVIQLATEGSDRVEVDERGDAVWQANGVVIRVNKPRIYQLRGGRREPVRGGFLVGKGRRLGFEMGAYDASKPLVIDPMIAYSTYLGAAGDDEASGIAVDSSGNTYVTGATSSLTFPTVNPVQAHVAGAGNFDTAFVSKLNATGTALIYSTYLGGTGFNGGSDLAVDAAGNAYIVGGTSSADFPTTPGVLRGSAFATIFLAKLNSSGSQLLYSTYFGSGQGVVNSNGGFIDSPAAIAIDGAGNACIAGITQAGSGFPTTAGAVQAVWPGYSQEAFVAKFNATATSLVFSTYLGGIAGASMGGLALDASGNIYVTGATSSRDFPTVNAFQPVLGGGTINEDAFVAKLNPTGTAFIYSSFLGGPADDQGNAIAVDVAGSAYITGNAGDGFPTTLGALQTMGGGRPVAGICRQDQPLGWLGVLDLRARWRLDCR